MDVTNEQKQMLTVPSAMLDLFTDFYLVSECCWNCWVRGTLCWVLIDSTHLLFFFFFGFVEAARAVNSVAKIGMELSSLELQLFDRICRSVLQNLREEAATRRAGNNVDINEQVVNLLSEVVELIDNCLIPLCPIEDCVLYNLMYVCLFLVVVR